MKKLPLILLLLLPIIWMACKKEVSVPPDLRDYFPSEPGTEWYYQNYVLDSSGAFLLMDSIDTVRIVARFDLGEYYQITIKGLHGSLPENWFLYPDKFKDESDKIWLAFEGDTLSVSGSPNTAYITNVLRQPEELNINGFQANIRGIDRVYKLNNVNYPYQPGYSLPLKFAQGIGIVQYEAKLVSNPFWFRKQIIGFKLP